MVRPLHGATARECAVTLSAGEHAATTAEQNTCAEPADTHRAAPLLADVVGSFFLSNPVHGMLISLNKRNTGRDNPTFNMVRRRSLSKIHPIHVPSI